MCRPCFPRIFLAPEYSTVRAAYVCLQYCLPLLLLLLRQLLLRLLLYESFNTKDAYFPVAVITRNSYVGIEVIFFSEEIMYIPYPRANNASI